MSQSRVVLDGREGDVTADRGFAPQSFGRGEGGGEDEGFLKLNGRSSDGMACSSKRRRRALNKHG
eukprot:752405-Hanusia_phi.AAC.2